MPKIIIDQKECEAKAGKNCLEVALENNLDLPYFCYHPALGAVGACRLCAVKQYKDAGDKTGRLVMSCMTPAQEGTRISVNDPDAVQFRKTVVELLMTNHPHDCPICDEGGECHLQDMTVMTGHRTRRFRGRKRTHKNQNLGPLIHHEMNRCIQCYRCVRYYQDYAGGHDLVALAQRNRVYFGRHEDGTLENPFAGNLIEICPTGVFTDKPFKKKYTRKWDLETAPSICTQCAVGCHILPAARYNQLRRITPRYNEAVNGYFICDRGRYGYEYHVKATRLTEVSSKNDGQRHPLEAGQAWRQLATLVGEAEQLAGIGSARASVESNYALRRLVGAERFYTGMDRTTHELIRCALAQQQSLGPALASIPDIERADGIIILGCDVTHELPRVDLAIRQAVKKGAELVIISARTTALDEIASSSQRISPEELLTSFKKLVQEKKIQKLKRPVLIGGWHQGSLELWTELGTQVQKWNAADTKARVVFASPQANSVGLGLLGGFDLDSFLEQVEAGTLKHVLVVENNLFENYPDELRLHNALKKLQTLIALDHSQSPVSALADLTVPVTTPIESNGLWINFEGRVGRAYQVYQTDPWQPESWTVLRELLKEKGERLHDNWKTPQALVADLVNDFPVFAPAQTLTVMALPKIPRLSPRATGRTALPVWKDVRTHMRPPQDTESPFSFSMEGNTSQLAPDLIPSFWAPNWNSQEAINKFQIELGKGLHGGETGIRLFDKVTGPVTAAGPVAEQTFGQPRFTLGHAQRFARATRRFDNTHLGPPAHSKLLIVPAAEVFGSESFSRLSSSIAQLVPTPYLDVHPETAKKFALHAGDIAKLLWSTDQTSLLKVRVREDIVVGIGVVPAHFPETHFLNHPTWAYVEGDSAS